MLITDIRKRKKAMSAVYIDGEYAVELDTEFLEENGIRVGVSLTDEQLHRLIEDSGLKRAKSKALYLLSHRDHSRKELKDKIKRDYDDKSAELAVQRMEELGFINDEAFAEKYAHDLLFIKKYSVRRTRYELIQKGIDKELSEEIIEKLNPDERELITSLVNKKYLKKLNDEKGRRQTFNALQRLGYSFEDIRAVIGEFDENNVY